MVILAAEKEGIIDWYVDTMTMMTTVMMIAETKK